MSNQPVVKSIFVGQPKTITDEKGTWYSSIYRDPVNGPIQLQEGGLTGDKVGQSYHGGPGAAICVHFMDHYRFWNEQYDMALQVGFVGENFVLENITEDEVCAGDIVRVGTALVQVSGPRVPCANLARRIGRPDWVKLTVVENRTGLYLRVLESGTVQASDMWDLQERLNPNGSIPAINHCFYLNFDAEYAKQVQDMEGLADWWKEQMAEKVTKQSEHWSDTMRA